MYETASYDYKDYTSENEEIPRGFDYNVSINGSQEPTRPKKKKVGIVSHDERGKKIRKVKMKKEKESLSDGMGHKKRRRNSIEKHKVMKDTKY